MRDLLFEYHPFYTAFRKLEGHRGTVFYHPSVISPSVRRRCFYYKHHTLQKEKCIYAATPRLSSSLFPRCIPRFV